ncbi:UDP-N-acetylglucosamine 2-epimerase (non-hydrolyzing) [Fulvivirga sp. M361]|uniref:non-hydrolyzing UDP-N-acetylglucosamine 2-epimerase n=1 Tax=Fulvivirga sp. M361 TaxID=2594266 RepID=UPI00117B0A63|nr:UDP-N-acetylglucosamine 2-epimerase (non-hydrolyzing) [Fulvivirga sp. M361]TRX50206.1 UDP-N-acetylglucosamine 2-epimerase (non-hydrolyzing) [Fulvivirga sp. M361]
MLIDMIAGARPNFMKVAPIINAIKKRRSEGADLSFRLVHTGQHYDKKMSESFFEQLNIPSPDVNFGVGSGTQAEQTAKIMTGYEQIILEEVPDVCLVVGDVTSTMACAITAKKCGVIVVHVEGGIRSGDWRMPEEVNRVVTDSITDYFYTTSEHANNNLRKQGVPAEKVVYVGNTMIDSLLANLERLQKPAVWDKGNLRQKEFILMTLHRPSNVDDGAGLKKIIDRVCTLSGDYPVIFPVHPRTMKMLDMDEMNYPNLLAIEPMGYLEFIYLLKHALAVVTDSGGITEEATVLGIPCMTLRDSTERPETIEEGTNELLGTDPESLNDSFDKLMKGNWKKGSIPYLWDGKTSTRIVDHLMSIS